jgi:hypothetical protein
MRLSPQRHTPHILGKGSEGLNIQDITTLITTVGFPIAACIALFWQNLKMSEMISNNTEAILELSTIIKERLPDGSN